LIDDIGQRVEQQRKLLDKLNTMMMVNENTLYEQLIEEPQVKNRHEKHDGCLMDGI
jgi:hypothetical protein